MIVNLMARACVKNCGPFEQVCRPSKVYMVLRYHAPEKSSAGGRWMSTKPSALT
jgi:hypothetical protein